MSAANVVLRWQVRNVLVIRHKNSSNNDIKSTTDTADIQFIFSESPNSLIVCEEEKNANHSVMVKENTLRIEVNDNKKWYGNIGIGFRIPKITIYLGKSEYGNISLKTDTGNIKICYNKL